MNLNQTIPMKMYELPLIAITRAMLGVGVGLLAAEYLDRPQRQAIGKTLALIGVVSTIPLAIDIMSKAGVGQDRLTGSINGRQQAEDLERAEKSWAGW